MKTIGLVGGMSWESTLSYYQIINKEVNKRLGGYRSAKCLIYSVDFAEIEYNQRVGNWNVVKNIIINSIRSLEKAGADFIVICTNTIHKYADVIQSKVNIPILHIAHATGKAIKGKKINTVGLLGTKYTMESNFYKDYLEKLNIKVIIPKNSERETINKIIFEELCLGKIKENSKKTIKDIINNLTLRGAEGVILGCTELPLIIKGEEIKISLFDTTYLHATEAVEYALKK
ncbi:aspartate/glutamate racemase family protein [Thermohalobacter berrensis]|uniref:Aspartate racemase n=1 Tax=Thermohalobacter berrensis TaxID=99594 RepID=A0A419TB58_9FIRM|nr:aspartate/glutamate racemase family protein [Thermohalobacter berrensis]RKD34692.1 aspartate racemase [Thermohalobacter berrensis]